MGWSRCSYAHEPGTAAVADKFGSAFSAGRLPTDDMGRTLENALTSEGISKEFKEWIAIAKDRPKWRQQTHSKPKRPDA